MIYIICAIGVVIGVHVTLVTIYIFKPGLLPDDVREKVDRIVERR